MHHVLFLTGCICTLMLVWFGVSFHSAWVMAVIVVSVCVLGIPHGGLDHLSGKKWLAPTWGSYWFVPFGSVYLGIAVVTVAGWLIYPFMTAISFFIISANHFGREQQLDKLASRWNVIRAIGSGGLVIWVPAWMRPAEMTQVLQAILPQSIGSSGETIVDGTQVLSLLFIPVAIVDAVHAITSATVRSQGGFDFAIRQLTLAVISAVLLVLLWLAFDPWAESVDEGSSHDSARIGLGFVTNDSGCDWTLRAWNVVLAKWTRTQYGAN
jgi:Brp/Blh family beta-carotene 15,15'-monooxygenase